MKAVETSVVHERDVACDGGKGPLGHPRVYLHIDAHSGQITCPYCSRQFILQQQAAATH